jgi:type IV secretion system protein VirD4
MRKPNIGKPRPPGTFSLIPLTLFCLITLTFWWIATQQLAAELAYQPELGPPWLHLWTWRLYLPWKILSWNYWYHVYAPREFMRALVLVYAGPFVGVIVVICYAVWQARRARIATTHGTAVWDEPRDAKTAGFLNGRGVVLGKLPDGRYLQHDGAEHVISIAPTRSGKGVGQIIPTLLTWPESVVVHDFKAENWDATSGARARFSYCLYFNPVGPESCHYNPLTEIRPGPNLIKDTQNVAQMIVDPDGKGLEDHWSKTSCSLLVGAILHVLYCEPDKTLAGIASFLADPRRDTLTTLRLMRETNYPDPVARKVIQSVAREMLNKDSRELSAVVSTAMSYLGLYRDPLVAANTANSDFSILDLLESDYPVSLYLVVPPSDKARLMPLMRLMWSQIGGRLTERLKRQGRRHRVLLMIDELPSLGRLEFIQHSLAFIAGYGIKAFLVAQSKKQLEEVYGKNHSIVDNCQVRTFFTPNDAETAQEISTMLGMTTEVHQQKMYTGHRLAPWLAHVMVSDQETARPLLTPGEVLTFPEDEAIVFVTGRPPLRAMKIRYFDDPTFAQRVLRAPVLRGTRPYLYGPARRGNPWKPATTATAEGPLGADRDEAKASTTTRPPAPPTEGAESETREAVVELPGWAAAAASDGGTDVVPEVLREDELELTVDGREALRDVMRRADFDRQDSPSTKHPRGGPQLGLDL